MATTYEICLAAAEAAEEWFDIDEVGITGPERVCGVAHVDTLALTAYGATAFTEDSLFAPGALVRFSRVTDGVRTLLFLGVVQPHARVCDPSESYTVELRGIWDWFERTIMLQDWTDDSAVTRSAPRVVLFSGDAGARLTTGQQIERCVARAIAAGCPCAAPASGDIDAGWSPAFDEQVNITVADAVCKALANHPHASCWIDYSERAPRLRVKTRQSLPSVNVSIVGNTSVSVRSREDLQPSAVAICYQKPMASGERQWMQTVVDYAPVVAGESEAATAARLSQAGALWAVFDLAGHTAQYQESEQTLEVEALDWATNSTSVDWWKRWCPMLNDGNISSIVLSDPDYTGTGAMPNILLSGAVQAWMGVETERETFTVDALITTGPSGAPLEVRKERISAEFTTTDGHSKTYRRRELTSLDTGDEIPEGIAAQMWAEWQQLHHEGVVAGVEEEPSLTLKPGATLNLTGGRTEWATMAAMIIRVTERFATGETIVEFGVPGWIDVDSRVAWHRNCRNRRYSMSRQISEPQDQPSVEETDDDAAGITGLPGSRDGGNTAHVIRRVFDDPDAAVAHSVDILAQAASGGFEFATSAHGTTARKVRIREAVLPIESEGAISGAKRVQLLASEPYGDLLPLGGGRPATPLNVITRGASTETDLSSSAAYDPATPDSGKDGVTIYLSLGKYYDHTAATPVLKEYRVALTWPNAIAPKISSAFTVEIDTPEV